MVAYEMASSSDVPKALDEELPAATGIAGNGTVSSDNLLHKVTTVTPECRFKSLQINDPDLSFDEKRQIAAEILTKSPAQFLARFGEFLDVEDLVYFYRFVECDYAVQFYTKEIEARQQRLQQPPTGHGPRRVTTDVRVRNRRYEALQKLIGAGEYFSDLQMKRRNPFMFEQMIGQYMTEREKDIMNKSGSVNMKLSTFLMEHIDYDLQDVQQTELESDKSKELGRSCSSSDEDDDDDDKSPSKSICIGRSAEISDQEKIMFREEFTSIMHHNFLDGKDADYNYSSVDDNADYDPINVKQQDAEDVYFDAEDPKTVTPPAESNSGSEESMDYDAPIACFIK